MFLSNPSSLESICLALKYETDSRIPDCPRYIECYRNRRITSHHLQSMQYPNQKRLCMPDSTAELPRHNTKRRRHSIEITHTSNEYDAITQGWSRDSTGFSSTQTATGIGGELDNLMGLQPENEISNSPARYPDISTQMLPDTVSDEVTPSTCASLQNVGAIPNRATQFASVTEGEQIQKAQSLSGADTSCRLFLLWRTLTSYE